MRNSLQPGGQVNSLAKTSVFCRTSGKRKLCMAFCYSCPICGISMSKDVERMLKSHHLAWQHKPRRGGGSFYGEGQVLSI